MDTGRLDRPSGSERRTLLPPLSSAPLVDPAGGDAAIVLPALPLMQGLALPSPPQKPVYVRVAGVDGPIASGELRQPARHTMSARRVQPGSCSRHGHHHGCAQRVMRAMLCQGVLH